MLKISKSELISYVNYLKKNNPSHLNIFSAILKHARLAKKMTLEEVSAGICSVSYLSKLENSQIEPKDEYVKFLFDRLDIDYTLAEDNDFEKILFEMIKCYYYNDKEKIIELVKGTSSTLFDCYSNLCYVIYDLIIGDFEDSKKRLEEVDSVKTSLSELGGIIYILLLGEYAVLTKDYHNCYFYLNIVSDYYIKYDEVRNLILEDLIVCLFNIRKYYELLSCYNLLRVESQISYPIERKTKLSLIYKIVLGLDNQKTASEILLFIEKHKDFTGEVDNFYLALLGLCKMNLYLDVIRIIEESGLYYKKNILALYGYAIYMSEVIEKYVGFLQMIQGIKEEGINDQDYHFINFLKLLLEGSTKGDIIEYIRYVLRPFCENSPHALYDIMYYLVYVDCLNSLSKYKDSALFLREKMKNM